MSLEVILEECAFLNMLATGIESYDKETFGHILGEKKSPDLYLVKYSLASVTSKRSRKSVYPSQRMKLIMSRYEDLGQKVLGDYHTHPDSDTDYSPADLEDMKTNRDYVYFIISVNQKSKFTQRKDWETKKHRLLGTFDFKDRRYHLDFTAYYFDDDEVKEAEVNCPFAYNFKS